jgi:hypothetical protein
MENLLIIGEGKDKKLILIDWGKSVKIGEKKAVAGSVAYGSRRVLTSYSSGKEHTYRASDDLSSFVRVLFSFKIVNIQAKLSGIINSNVRLYALDISDVWDYCCGLYDGFGEILEAGDDGDYDKIMELIDQNYFFLKIKV